MPAILGVLGLLELVLALSGRRRFLLTWTGPFAVVAGGLVAFGDGATTTATTLIRQGRSRCRHVESTALLGTKQLLNFQATSCRRSAGGR